jgi:beta-glucosidase
MLICRAQLAVRGYSYENQRYGAHQTCLDQTRRHSGRRLAHGDGRRRHVRAITQRSSRKGKAGTNVGPAEVIEGFVPLIETTEHINAARTATREANAPFLTVMLEGKYTDAYLKQAGADAPKFTDEDLKIISSPLDFVGINVYRPIAYVLASDQASG